MSCTPSLLLERIMSALEPELERAQKRARARTFELSELEEFLRELLDRRPRWGGVRLVAGAVPLSYMYEAQATHVEVAWYLGRVHARAWRGPAPKREWGKLPRPKHMSRAEVRRLVAPDLEFELERRRVVRAARSRGLDLPPEYRERGWLLGRLVPAKYRRRRYLVLIPAEDEHRVDKEFHIVLPRRFVVRTRSIFSGYEANLPEFLESVTGVPRDRFERLLFGEDLSDEELELLLVEIAILGCR